MSQIFDKIKNVDANNSEAVKEALTTFFQHIGKNSNQNAVICLRTLEYAITKFPKYCMSHRYTIETYLKQFFDSKSQSVVIEAAKCAHVLQQVRPIQDKSATPKSCWRDQIALLCNAGHELTNTIFTHTIDIFKNGYFQRSNQGLPNASSPLSVALSEIKNLNAEQSAQDKQTLLSNRLKNIFTFIQAMLVEVYPVGKPVRPQIILDLIVRVLSITNGVQHSDAVFDDISDIKIQALRTVDALVICLGPNMIPFSSLVFRLIMQTLRWTSEPGNEKYREVRCQVYSSLTNWLTTLHGYKPHCTRLAGKKHSLEEDLITSVIKDITPQRHVVQLTMSTHPTKNLSKKAKRKLANTRLQESSIASYMPGEKNISVRSQDDSDDVAIAALECAEIFLMASGVFFNPAIHELLQERLIRECYALEQYSRERALSLCRTLEAARKCIPPNVAPPTQYCLQLYSTLVNSKHKEISKFSSQALLDIRLQLHCSPPSLDFNIEAQSSSNEKKRAMSEKNRASLETLLGPDRLQKTISQSNQIITVPDEPTCKRAKLDVNNDDETDKISISSQSSVEINAIYVEDENEDNIHDIETQIIGDSKKPNDDIEIIVEEFDSETLINNKKQQNIHELKTQLPVNVSNETIEQEQSPHSLEVTYDYPNGNNSKVTVFEKMEDENLPSTNDTDDVQITCGQLIRNSPNSVELSPQKNKPIEIIEPMSETVEINNKNVDDPTLDNVINKNDTDLPPNGDVIPLELTGSKLSIKITTGNNEEISVEDMMADFVDEVNDENKANV